jgi:hypothetical protein
MYSAVFSLPGHSLIQKMEEEEEEEKRRGRGKGKGR